ncbi:aminotransferase class I/II-fold pyridoxal phosphate-dependent enzyme [Tamlana sp. 62-3]|uniref:Aminotransferase class I/II-fold pyridoxal phosphate-dependent enzyme n=1 Tax=Neotamlana sargassicola TaxID=2883125 RepID=A0A9X1I5Y1_9FLAO|nr:aminotransferase class I/II-fold pyridoxal phosphate-dependent enzyme [Tamlana sargassicola]MCB4807314.1 aminotransferase class I/II-fold pyridoxal phosphate-dependent enzyme [Tamlana sargassicola]
MKPIKLSLAHNANNEVKYVEEAVLNNQLSNYGNNLNVFNKQLETYFSKPNRIALLNSGTSAIHLALIQLGIKANDEVICQSFTFSATANPIVYQKAIPIFIDSEPETWNMCPVQLETAIKDRMSLGIKPKAIIVVHSYGMPAKIDEILKISEKFSIPLIEDAAGALGSTYKGLKCGSFGEFGIISFNGNKIITSSSGGALICTAEDQKIKANFLATQSKANKPFYHHEEIGYNYSMSNIVAGIGRAQMEVLKERVLKRREVNVFYKEIFEGINGITLLTEPSEYYYSNHWLTCILINFEEAGFSNEDLKKELEKHNIETRFLWKPLHLQPIFSEFPYYGKSSSEQLFNIGLCLPSGSNLSIQDKVYIKSVIMNFISKK